MSYSFGTLDNLLKNLGIVVEIPGIGRTGPEAQAEFGIRDGSPRNLLCLCVLL